MKKKWITKAEISKILRTYSIRKDEFQPVKNQGYFFQSDLVAGYTVQIEQETLKGEITVKTDRIMVTHSQSNGKKTYVDIWQHDPHGDLQFRFRNLWDQPLSDADYIKELEQKNMQLQQAWKESKDQLAADKPVSSSNHDKQDGSHGSIHDTNAKEEILCLRRQINELEEKYQKLKNDTHVHNARGAGRKPSKERLDAINQVKSLLESGCSDQAIMKQLGISRATFYRYKKSLNN